MDVSPNIALQGVRGSPGSTAILNQTVVFRIGQVVRALVLDNDQGNGLRLRIAGQTFRAQGGHDFRAGQQVALRVIETGPQPILKPLSQSPTNTSDPVSQVLRQRLPVQRPLTELLSQLNQFAPQSGKRTAMQPNTSIEAVARNLLRFIPTLPELTSAAGLRTALNNSGLFLENSLARLVQGTEKQSVSQDLKLGLLNAHRQLSRLSESNHPREAARLSESPTQAAARDPIGSRFNDHTTDPAGQLRGGGLMRAVDAAIARIETNQLATHQARDDGVAEFYFELPIKVGRQLEVAKLQIRRDGGHDSDGPAQTSPTTINLEIPISENASLLAELKHNNAHLGIRLWSEDATLRGVLEHYLERLDRRLGKLELGSVRIETTAVTPPSNSCKKFSQLLEVSA